MRKINLLLLPILLSSLFCATLNAQSYYRNRIMKMDCSTFLKEYQNEKQAIQNSIINRQEVVRRLGGTGSGEGISISTHLDNGKVVSQEEWAEIKLKILEEKAKECNCNEQIENAHRQNTTSDIRIDERTRDVNNFIDLNNANAEYVKNSDELIQRAEDNKGNVHVPSTPIDPNLLPKQKTTNKAIGQNNQEDDDY